MFTKRIDAMIQYIDYNFKDNFQLKEKRNYWIMMNLFEFNTFDILNNLISTISNKVWKKY